MFERNDWGEESTVIDGVSRLKLADSLATYEEKREKVTDWERYQLDRWEPLPLIPLAEVMDALDELEMAS